MAELYDVLYEGLRAGWLALDDLGPDLAGVQVWVPLAEPCPVHRDAPDACPQVALHEFAVGGEDCCCLPCDPDGSLPATTATVRAVRVLWSDGWAEQLSRTHAAYLHPVIARRRPTP